MPPARLRTLLLSLTLLPALALAAPGRWHQGNLTIRYNALPASALPARSLKQLGVDDPAHKGLLNILVTRGKDADETSLSADIDARATTETGSPVRIQVREIRDANGISYLGVYRVDHTGALRFDLDVTPQGEPTRHIHFTHTLVVD